jgi:hypothetical protein
VLKSVVTLAAVVTAVFTLPGVSLAGEGAEVVPNRFCQIQVGEVVYDGEGITVVTPSGGRLIRCRVVVPEGPVSTLVFLAGAPKGNIFVFTRSGQMIVIFTVCGPSEPTDVCA